jgi:hypothetical protein
VTATGLGLPIVTTEKDAAAVTREFRWLIAHAGADGVPLTDGAVEPAFVVAGCEGLDSDEDHLLRLVEAARRMRLVYRRNGRLLVKKDVAAAASSPIAFWSALAEALMRSAVVDSTTRDIVLLAIADGSVTLGDAWLERAAEAAALVRDHRWGWHFDVGHRDAQRYGYGADLCGSPCDCPQVDGSTWHDVVAAAIRDAAAEGACEGALTVAHGTDSDDLLSAGVLPEWIVTGAGRGVETSRLDGPVYGSGLGEGGSIVTPAEFLRDAEGLVGLLTFFGLGRGDDDRWVVSPALREFARAALQVPVIRRSAAGWTDESTWNGTAWTGGVF